MSVIRSRYLNYSMVYRLRQDHAQNRCHLSLWLVLSLFAAQISIRNLELSPISIYTIQNLVCIYMFAAATFLALQQ